MQHVSGKFAVTKTFGPIFGMCRLGRFMSDPKWFMADPKWFMSDPKWFMADPKWFMSDPKWFMTDPKWFMTDPKWFMTDRNQLGPTPCLFMNSVSWVCFVFFSTGLWIVMR